MGALQLGLMLLDLLPDAGKLRHMLGVLCGRFMGGDRRGRGLEL